LSHVTLVVVVKQQYGDKKQHLPKFTQIGFFGLKIYHLATLQSPAKVIIKTETQKQEIYILYEAKVIKKWSIIQFLLLNCTWSQSYDLRIYNYNAAFALGQNVFTK
jgi:hypothetical protein